MPSRISKNKYFMTLATFAATRSTCSRRSVGCVIVNERNQILSTGYNGVPKNFPHCTDYPCGGHDKPTGDGLDSCYAIHAEQNALLQCPDTNEIYAIYTTVFPCFSCAKLIANTSCRRVYYSNDYAHSKSVYLLKDLGIECYDLSGILH